jgi:hypothetical protein
MHAWHSMPKRPAGDLWHASHVPPLLPLGSTREQTSAQSNWANMPCRTTPARHGACSRPANPVVGRKTPLPAPHQKLHNWNSWNNWTMIPVEKHIEMARPTLAVLFLCVLIAASLWILRPFLPALIWATMVVVATWPLMLRAQRRFGNRRWPAVILMTFLVLLDTGRAAVGGHRHHRRQRRRDYRMGQVTEQPARAVATRLGCRRALRRLAGSNRRGSRPPPPAAPSWPPRWRPMPAI